MPQKQRENTKKATVKSEERTKTTERGCSGEKKKNKEFRCGGGGRGDFHIILANVGKRTHRYCEKKREGEETFGEA